MSGIPRDTSQISCFGVTSPLAVCLYFALEAVGDSQIDGGKSDGVEELTP